MKEESRALVERVVEVVQEERNGGLEVFWCVLAFFRQNEDVTRIPHTRAEGCEESPIPSRYGRPRRGRCGSESQGGFC